MSGQAEWEGKAICPVCSFEGESDSEHVLHAHAVLLALAKRFNEERGKVDRLKELFQAQKKNRLILQLSGQVRELEGELAAARREIGELRTQAKGAPDAPEGTLPEDARALLADMRVLGLSVEAGVDPGE